jgi:hypothetical protein
VPRLMPGAVGVHCQTMSVEGGGEWLGRAMVIAMEVAGVDSQAPERILQLANGEPGRRTLIDEQIQSQMTWSCSHAGLACC